MGSALRPSPVRRRRTRRQWRPRERIEDGPCTYCGRTGPLTWDHAIPRSLIPGELRDDRRNLIPACWPCNVGRTEGRRPRFDRLPAETRAFVLEQIGPVRAARLFEGIS